MWIRTSHGLAVIFGCAHAGVVNTLDHIARLTGGDNFYALVGGMHLVNADERRITATVRAFRERGVRLLCPCHCTGETAARAIKKEFPREFVTVGAGTKLRL
jgi:7,8-dihydropterin-6-yl-methyl-4-(beta-D-ribofuranosyl)aminobenzene 5'-phosphate synthase